MTGVDGAVAGCLQVANIWRSFIALVCNAHIAPGHRRPERPVVGVTVLDDLIFEGLEDLFGFSRIFPCWNMFDTGLGAPLAVA